MGLPDADPRNVVRDQALEHAEGAGPLDVDLPEVGEIEEPNALANGTVLRERPFVFDRHQPSGEGAELGAERHVNRLERRVLELRDPFHRGLIVRGAPAATGSAEDGR